MLNTSSLGQSAMSTDGIDMPPPDQQRGLTPPPPSSLADRYGAGARGRRDSVKLNVSDLMSPTEGEKPPLPSSQEEKSLPAKKRKFAPLVSLAQSSGAL